MTYELPCVYNAEGDMRKYVNILILCKRQSRVNSGRASTKTAIEKLERRVLQLESLLQQQSNQQPDQQDTVSVSDAGAPLTKELVTTSSQRARQHSMTTDMAQTPSIQGQLPSNSENASPSVNGGVSQETAIASAEEEPPLASPHGDVPILPALDDFEFLPQDDTEEIVQDIQPLDLHPANGTRSDISPQQVQLTIDHSTSGREDTGSDLEDILSARMGLLRLSEDGQLRYYGPTSNLNIQNNGTHALSRSTIRDVSAEGNNVLRKLGLDHPVSLTLETHLAKLYFSWEDPAIHVVDEEAFFREKEKYLSGTNSPYYSETLNNAM